MLNSLKMRHPVRWGWQEKILASSAVIITSATICNVITHSNAENIKAPKGKLFQENHNILNIDTSSRQQTPSTSFTITP